MDRPEVVTLKAFREAARSVLATLKEKARTALTPGDRNLFLGIVIIPIPWIVVTSRAYDLPFWKDILFGFGAYTFTVVFASMMWAALSAKTHLRMLGVWVATAVTQSLLWSLIFDPGSVVLPPVLAVLGYGALSALLGERPAPPPSPELTPILWGLPMTVAEAAAALPEQLPPEVEKLLDEALVDAVHLGEVIHQQAPSVTSPLGRLQLGAWSTLTEMMVQATRVASLGRLARERADDPAAAEAAALAHTRLTAMASSLNEAASSALRFVVAADGLGAPSLEALIQDLSLHTRTEREVSNLTRNEITTERERAGS